MRLAAVAIATFALAAPHAFADPPTATPSIQGMVLEVDTVGVSRAQPDMATVEVAVVTHGADAASASQLNTLRMTPVMQALRNAGVAERDMHSEELQIEAQNDDRNNRIVGYEASHDLRVVIRDINRVGPVLDAAIAGGANGVNQLSFGFIDPTPQLDAARRDAVAEARRRAEVYAQAFGLHVFRILHANEGSGAGNDDEVVVVTGSRLSRQAMPITIAPGEIETSAHMHVTFELR